MFDSLVTRRGAAWRWDKAQVKCVHCMERAHIKGGSEKAERKKSLNDQRAAQEEGGGVEPGAAHRMTTKRGLAATTAPATSGVLLAASRRLCGALVTGSIERACARVSVCVRVCVRVHAHWLERLPAIGAAKSLRESHDAVTICPGAEWWGGSREVERECRQGETFDRYAAKILLARLRPLANTVRGRSKGSRWPAGALP